MKRKKSFRVKKRDVIFSKGPIHLVDCDVSMRNGRVLSRQILEHPGSVVIIPKLGPRQYVLVRQFRFATGGWLWEFPAGGIEPRESLRKTAVRELMEEIKYRPHRLKKIAKFYPTPGISGEIMHLFLAEDLVPARKSPDEDEDLQCRIFSLSAIERMIQRGVICDAKTILGFFYLKEFLSLS